MNIIQSSDDQIANEMLQSFFDEISNHYDESMQIDEYAAPLFAYANRYANGEYDFSIDDDEFIDSLQSAIHRDIRDAIKNDWLIDYIIIDDDDESQINNLNDRSFAIARIIAKLICDSFELCAMHGCDIQICIDDEIDQCAKYR